MFSFAWLNQPLTRLAGFIRPGYDTDARSIAREQRHPAVVEPGDRSARNDQFPAEPCTTPLPQSTARRGVYCQDVARVFTVVTWLLSQRTSLVDCFPSVCANVDSFHAAISHCGVERGQIVRVGLVRRWMHTARFVYVLLSIFVALFRLLPSVNRR